MKITTKPRFIYPEEVPHKKGRLAVIDIGSSSVRLVVYDDSHYPHLYLNHKVWTALGKHKGKSEFLLKDEAMERTINAIHWFLWVCQESEVKTVVAIASSAVRDAKNGEEFVSDIYKSTGLHVEIISGEVEARLAALGASSSIPNTHGLVLDLGGGSLDICEVSSDEKGGNRDKEKIISPKFNSIPLGVLSLAKMSNNNPQEAERIMYEALSEIDFVADGNHQNLLALGSGMRSLATLHMAENSYPMKIFHDYRISRDDALEFCEKFMQGRVNRKLKQMTKEWREVLPYRAAALSAILKATNADCVRFASFGVREGLFFSQSDKDVMNGDPLLTFGEDMAERDGRGSNYAYALSEWCRQTMKNLQISQKILVRTSQQVDLKSSVDNEDNKAKQSKGELSKRILKAAALFADIGWREQASYRAMATFEMVYGGSFVAVGHRERALLALIAFFRHEDKLHTGMMPRIKGVVNKNDLWQARVIGAIFNLASSLDPGAKGILENYSIKLDNENRLVLDGPSYFVDMQSEEVNKRLSCLNRVINSK